MEYISVFSHKSIGTGNYLVTETYSPDFSVNAGVIVGGERILVVDTGLGLGGNLRKYIESFAGTKLPIFCMCTHGDVDCIGGIGLFDEAYLNEADARMEDHFKLDFRLAALSGITEDENMRSFGKLMASDISGVRLRNMRQGDHHHLGGVHVEVFEIPGITPGSCAVRITREGVARTSFVGDALDYDKVSRLTGENRKAYIEKLRELAEIMTEDEPMYGTHRSEPMVREDITALADTLAAEA